jgi:hypothetical protein
VNGEGRSVPLVNGSFSDTFGAYAVHVYEVAAATGSVSEVDAGTAAVVSGTAAPSASAFAVATRIGVAELEKREELSFDERLGV